MVLFICVNACLSLVNIPGSPISAPYDSCYSPGFGTGPGNDPVANNSDKVNAGSATEVENMADMIGEVQNPTQQTEVSEGVWSGPVDWWNSATNSIERSYKSIVALGHLITGGYLMDTLDHVTISCVIDTDVASPTYNQLIRNESGYCIDETHANYSVAQQYEFVVEGDESHCTTVGGTWNTGNAMWNTIKGAVQVIFGFLVILTLYYWISGRGHILSS